MGSKIKELFMALGYLLIAAYYSNNCIIYWRNNYSKETSF